MKKLLFIAVVIALTGTHARAFRGNNIKSSHETVTETAVPVQPQAAAAAPSDNPEDASTLKAIADLTRQLQAQRAARMDAETKDAFKK